MLRAAGNGVLWVGQVRVFERCEKEDLRRIL